MRPRATYRNIATENNEFPPEETGKWPSICGLLGGSYFGLLHPIVFRLFSIDHIPFIGFSSFPLAESASFSLCQVNKSLQDAKVDGVSLSWLHMTSALVTGRGLRLSHSLISLSLISCQCKVATTLQPVVQSKSLSVWQRKCSGSWVAGHSSSSIVVPQNL